MVEPRHAHLIPAKHVLRYLRDIVYYGLRYVMDCEFRLLGYSDSDWVGSVTYWKSTSGCCFSLGSNMISWFSRKQTSVALSMIEVEYSVASSACSEAMWLQKLLTGLFDLELDVTCIFYDNQSYKSYQRTLYFMTSISTSRLGIIMPEIWWKGEQWSSSMFPPIN